MKCLVCNIDQDVRQFRCRLCGRFVGAYCEVCWLERKLFEIFEANCRVGKPHGNTGNVEKGDLP